MAKATPSYLVGYDAKTGEFVPARKVYANPKSKKYVVTRVAKDISVTKSLRKVILGRQHRRKKSQ